MPKTTPSIPIYHNSQQVHLKHWGKVIGGQPLTFASSSTGSRGHQNQMKQEFFTPERSCHTVLQPFEATDADLHMLKLSPQPHVPLMLGLLNTNSAANLLSTKSISVPRRVSWALESMYTLTPGKTNVEKHCIQEQPF